MNSPKNWNLQVDPAVAKTLERIPRRNAERILEAIKFLQFNPYVGDIQKMKDEESVWRRRIGSYRLFYKIKTPEKVILVFHIERRTSKTY